MKNKFIQILMILLLFSCGQNKQNKYDNDELHQARNELAVFGQDVVKKHLINVSGDSLYKNVLERYSNKKSYSISFLKSKEDPVFTVFTIPNFTISKNETTEKAYIFSKDSMFIKAFLLHEKTPFAEINLQYDNLHENYRMDYIQGVRISLWQHYKSKIDKGYPVFMCNIKLQDGSNEGTLFLPYIFYVNGKDDIIAHSWIGGFELTMDEISEKHLK